MGTRCADHVTPLYPQKLALTSPTGGGRSVGIVRSRTKATESHLCKTLLRIWSKWQGHLLVKETKVVLSVYLIWFSGTCCAAVFSNNITKPTTTSQFLQTVAISAYDSVGTAVLNLILCQKSCIACIFRDNVTSKRHLRNIMCNCGSVAVLSVAAVTVAVHGKYKTFHWI